MTLANGLRARLVLASAAALALTACGSSGSYRVASVGSTPAGSDSADSSGGAGTTGAGTGGSTGSGGGTATGASVGKPVLVSAGNAMMGASGTLGGTASVIPASGVVTGTVDRVLNRTGQTLVRLGNGQSVLLNGTGGNVGDPVSLNLGTGKVVGGSAPLVGLNALARNPSTGQLATIGANNGGALVSVTAPQTGVGNGAITRTVNGAGNLVNGATGNVVTAGLNGNAGAGNNSVAAVANGAAGKGGTGLGATVNAATQPVTGTVNTALNGPK